MPQSKDRSQWPAPGLHPSPGEGLGLVSEPKFDDGVGRLGLAGSQARQVLIAPIRNIYDPRGLSSPRNRLVCRLHNVQSITVDEEWAARPSPLSGQRYSSLGVAWSTRSIGDDHPVSPAICQCRRGPGHMINLAPNGDGSSKSSEERQALEAQLKQLADADARTQIARWKQEYEQKIRLDAVQRIMAVTRGKVTEHIVPCLPDFDLDPKEISFPWHANRSDCLQGTECFCRRHRHSPSAASSAQVYPIALGGGLHELDPFGKTNPAATLPAICCSVLLFAWCPAHHC